jgi:hypothetical protein
MDNEPEMKILSQDPDAGNLTPTRQGRCTGAPVRVAQVHQRKHGERARHPVREGLVEAIGAQPFRTQVKRRKAAWVGESAAGDEAQFASGAHDVLATGWLRCSLFLPEEFCWVPCKR